MNKLLIGIFLVPGLAQAQAQPQPQAQPASSGFPIATDRPSFSDASSLVPVGHPQLEIGLTYTSLSGSHVLTVGEGLFRYAVADRFELRLSNGTYQSVTQGGTVSGLVDPSIGFKYRFVDGVYTGRNRRPEVTLVAQTTLPGGATVFRVNRSQPTGILAWSYALDSATTVGGNLVASDLGPTGARFTQYAASLYASRTLTSTTSVFWEVYGLAPEVAAGPNAGFTDAGVEYLLNQRTQLDFRIGTGFNSSRDGVWIGAGISYRF